MRRRKVALLITESKKDFIRGHKSLADQIGARGPVEELFVDDLAYNDWEADRFRRIGTALFNTAIPQAVENLLKQLLSREDFKTLPELHDAAEDLGRRWPSDREIRAFVIKLLRENQLDESAIEAEAFRLCAADLEAVSRIVAFKQVRRDKDLGMIAEIRQGSLGFLQATTSSALEEPALEDDVPRLIATSNRRG